MFKDFKEFITKGDVIDLAIAVVMGSAFGKIVSTLVNYVLVPLLGIFFGGIDFSGLSVKVKNAILAYGQFIQAVIDFLIIAVAVFIIVGVINKLKKKRAASPPIPTDEVRLLGEIRDSLSQKEKK